MFLNFACTWQSSCVPYEQGALRLAWPQYRTPLHNLAAAYAGVPLSCILDFHHFQMIFFEDQNKCELLAVEGPSSFFDNCLHAAMHISLLKE